MQAKKRSRQWLPQPLPPPACCCCGPCQKRPRSSPCAVMISSESHLGEAPAAWIVTAAPLFNILMCAAARAARAIEHGHDRSHLPDMARRAVFHRRHRARLFAHVAHDICSEANISAVCRVLVCYWSGNEIGTTTGGGPPEKGFCQR